MRTIRSSSLVAMVFVVALAVPVGAAQSAAPRYMSSEPAKGEKLHQAPDRVEVTFSEPLDQSSDLTVKDSCGRRLDDGDVTVEANTMTVGIKLKPSGHYMVGYLAKGIAGLTGQTADEFHFEVHAGTPCGKTDGGGHGNHNNKKTKRGGHHGRGGDHGGGGDHGRRSEHADDGGHDSGANPHSGMNQSSHSPSGAHGTRTHTGADGDMSHRSRGGGGHGDAHRDKQGKRHGNRHGNGDHSTDDVDGRTVASGEGDPFGEPNGSAVLLALGLSLGIGVLGGWFLRVSGGP